MRYAALLGCMALVGCASGTGQSPAQNPAPEALKVEVRASSLSDMGRWVALMVEQGWTDQVTRFAFAAPESGSPAIGYMAQIVIGPDTLVVVGGVDSVRVAAFDSLLRVGPFSDWGE